MITILGRLRPILTTACRQKKSLSLEKNNVRNAGTVLYRRHEPVDPKGWHIAAQALSTFLWYWILYHCYYEFDHLVPEVGYPDTSKFTNEELGIPPDDE